MVIWESRSTVHYGHVDVYRSMDGVPCVISGTFEGYLRQYEDVREYSIVLFK